MTSPQATTEHPKQTTSPDMVDMKLEVVIIPVADADRSKRFYTGLGWRLDADFAFDNGFRVVQFTPPGSACSVQFGTKMIPAPPGSSQSVYLVVSDLEAARADLLSKGVAVSEVFHPEMPGAQFQPDNAAGRAAGPAPNHASYSSFATFKDPDGNGWLMQEVKTRLPGRGFASDVASLTELLREAEKRHGEYEPTAPKHHWSGWYAAYIIARERAKTSDEAFQAAVVNIEGERR